MTSLQGSYTQEIPAGMIAHAYEREYMIDHFIEDVWRVLIRKDTFVDDQIWPYRVEFMNEGTLDMETGEENIHHGPLMSFGGIMGEITPPVYRDLNYYYGSYFLSIRWIRPSRLQIWLEPGDGSHTRVKVRLTSWVHPSIATIWTFMQRIFWKNFGKWISKLTRKSLTRV